MALLSLPSHSYTQFPYPALTPSPLSLLLLVSNCCGFHGVFFFLEAVITETRFASWFTVPVLFSFCLHGSFMARYTNAVARSLLTY